MNELMNVYDRICDILTNYERDDGDEDAGDRLYCELCRLANEMAEKM